MIEWTAVINCVLLALAVFGIGWISIHLGIDSKKRPKPPEDENDGNSTPQA